MDSTIFNDITSAFTSAIQGGFGTLAVYALPLLGVLGLIYLVLRLSEAVLRGSNLNDLLANPRQNILYTSAEINRL